MLELGVTFSFAQLIIDNEIAGMVKRVVQGINVSDDTLAVELVKKIGSEKDYLAEKHTRQYMKSEQSQSRVDRPQDERELVEPWGKRLG